MSGKRMELIADHGGAGCLYGAPPDQSIHLTMYAYGNVKDCRNVLSHLEDADFDDPETRDVLIELLASSVRNEKARHERSK